ncbi:MAG: TolC family protein [Bacteroidales bacterium]|nr:TolC family protein [Bacteroidales bacterium]
MRKHILLPLFLFSLVCTAFSQNVVTIEECQQWAVAQSSANVQKELNDKLLKVKLNNAASHIFPKLEINGEAVYRSDVPQIYPYVAGTDTFKNHQYFIGVDFEQVLFEGGKLYYGRRYEKLANQAEIYKVEISINEMKEQIITLYLNLLILDKQLNILTNAEDVLQEQLSQLNSLQANGIIPASAVSQLEVEMLKVGQNKGELQAKKESLIASLSILTGKDLSQAEFAVPEVPSVDINSPSARLEYKIFDNGKQTMEFQRKLYLANSLPRLSLFATGGYGRPNYNYFNPNFKWYYEVGVRLNVPLIDWAKSTGVSNVINLQKAILSSQENDFAKGNNIAIQEKRFEIQRIEDMLKLDKRITEKQKEITNAFSIQLMNGTITAYDYIKQQNDETQSLINQEVHAIQLLKAKYELLALTGRL